MFSCYIVMNGHWTSQTIVLRKQRLQVIDVLNMILLVSVHPNSRSVFRRKAFCHAPSLLTLPFSKKRTNVVISD